MQGFRDGKVFVFEPSPEHINVIALDIDQNLLEDRVFIVPNGLGEFTNPVQGIDSLLSAIADTGNSVANVEDAAPILALEDFLPLQGIDRRDCIKLDVEGFELKALKGAAAALKVYRPRLGVSLYHKPEDFFEIPIYLKTHFPIYRRYLDHYPIARDETVLYAIADQVGDP